MVVKPVPKMKIRCGFVSNSSSGSYIVLGWHIGNDQTRKAIDMMLDKLGITQDTLFDKDKFLHIFPRDIFFGVLLEYTNEQEAYDKYIERRPLIEIIKELEELTELGKKYGFDIEDVETHSGCFET